MLAEAGDQAQDLMGQARSQLASQAATQQENLTTWLRSLADELHQMVDRGSDQGSSSPSDSSPEEQHRVAASSGVATNAVSQAQGRVKEAADWLEKHEPGNWWMRRRVSPAGARARSWRSRPSGGCWSAGFTRGLKDDTSSSTTPPSGATSDTDGSATRAGDATLGYDATSQPINQLDEQRSGVMGVPVSPVAPAAAGFGAGDPVGQEPR